MILDEIHVRSITHDDTTFVSLVDLTGHLAMAAKSFHEEAVQSINDRDEMIYTVGLAQGIVEVVRFLAQSGLEDYMERNIHTVEDLLDS